MTSCLFNFPFQLCKQNITGTISDILLNIGFLFYVIDGNWSESTYNYYDKVTL